jgi:hypothetical protein
MIKTRADLKEVTQFTQTENIELGGRENEKTN